MLITPLLNGNLDETVNDKRRDARSSAKKVDDGDSNGEKGGTVRHKRKLINVNKRTVFFFSLS